MKNLIEESGRLPEISDKIVLMVRELRSPQISVRT